ncbi:hypothetical protein ACR79B_20615 [Sphingobacterium spiritivorum]|uniref:hypothetical protein n=1 Tax=Sphingobacterium spiritivorum TaxID=258 RepID=UPI003DA59B3D
MDNTLKNKAKFFAQYWGQNVRFWTLNGPKNLFKVAHAYMTNSIVESSSLELKPLSDISDEEAAVVIDIYNKSCNKPRFQSQIKEGLFDEVFKQIYWIYPSSDPNDDGYRVIANFSDNDVNVINSPNTLEMHSQCIDYLRSKGYAFPWMGIPVEKQVEYGWITLKESEVIYE